MDVANLVLALLGVALGLEAIRRAASAKAASVSTARTLSAHRFRSALHDLQSAGERLNAARGQSSRRVAQTALDGVRAAIAEVKGCAQVAQVPSGQVDNLTRLEGLLAAAAAMATEAETELNDKRQQPRVALGGLSSALSDAVDTARVLRTIMELDPGEPQ